MNPMTRQHQIREFELLVSDGVHEVPESVFERDARASGEIRVVRDHSDQSAGSSRSVSRTIIGKVKINQVTGDVME